MWYSTSLPSKIADIIADDSKQFADCLFDGLIINKGMTDKRSTKVSFIPENHWISGFVMHYAFMANNLNYHYDLTGIDSGALQYGIYGVNDHYDWHSDYDLTIMGQFPVNNNHGVNKERIEAVQASSSEFVRKLSFSLQLTEEYQYEGGDLQIMERDGTTHSMPREKGTIIFFDSRIVHRVTPVTKGERRSIVGWITGPRWK
jgi:PKHD-type hydroxylase